jgi:CRISPR system Cascade subunit CasD
MTQFLMLTLYAPLASWGEIAVGENRDSWDRPSRSAILGLLAASLGIDRGDQAAHDALDDGYGLAVLLDAPGVAVVDYHTAQTVAESVLKKSRPATRKAMLEAGERETILSRRTYRADSLAAVALWARPDARWPLGEFVHAIKRPGFVPYAGRKSNPFGLPLRPEIVEAPTVAGAFATRPPELLIESLSGEFRILEPRSGWGREVAHDLADTEFTGLDPFRRETRRDTRPQRTRWQFAERTVGIGRLPEPQGSAS